MSSEAATILAVFAVVLIAHLLVSSSDPNPTSNNNNTFDCAMQRVNQMISMTAQALDLEIHTVLEHIANLKRSF